MQRFTTVLKTPNRMEEPSSLPIVSTRANIYVKNQPIKSPNDYSSSPLTSPNSDSSSDTNNETVTLTNANSSFANHSPRYSRPAGPRRFFSGKSKSAAVSRSASNTSRIMAAEKMYIKQNSSEEEHLSTSESDDLDSDDEESKLVYKTCMESPPITKGIYLKKSLSRPECALKNFQFNSIDSKPDSNRRFIKNNSINNRLRTSKSMSHCKNSAAFHSNEDEEDEEDEEEEDEEESMYYRQLDGGNMKSGKLSRFKVIKSKSNSTFGRGRKYDESSYAQNDILNKKSKGSQKDDQITSQLQLNELAERLKFIEQKLLQNEMNTEKKPQNMNQNITSSSSSSYQSGPTFNQTIYPQAPSTLTTTHSNYSQNSKPQNQDDLCLKNGQFHARIYPSISFGDCSEMHHLQPKNQKNKRNFFFSAKSAVKNSRSIPSLFNGNSSKDKIEKESSLAGSNIKSSANKSWKTPFNIISNLVDDKLRGRWHSSKSVKSSSSSLRSNSICSASNLTNKRSDQQPTKLDKPLYGPIFNNNRTTETKSLSTKIMNNFSNLSSRKNSQNNQSNASSRKSSQNDLVRSSNGSNNSSRFSSTKQLNGNQLIPLQSKLPLQKARAQSAPNDENEEIFNLLSLPFLDEEAYKKSNEHLDRFEYKVKQSKSYKEIGSQALKEIEAFEKLLSDKIKIHNQ